MKTTTTRMTLFNLMMLSLIASCGRDGGGDEEPAKVESQEQPVLVSMAIQTLADLPACEEKNNKQLIYVIETKIFMTCQNKDWQEVSIKGDKGDKGDTTTAQPNARDLPVNMWYDAVADKYWMVGRNSSWTDATNTSTGSCTGSYKLPSKDELMTAAIHGLYYFASKNSFPLTVWSTDESSGNAYSVTLAENGTASQLEAKNNLKGIYCREK